MKTTFEEINQQIDSTDLTQFQEGGVHHFTAEAAAANPGNVLQKVCGIYNVIKPILKGISDFPLIPGKWRAAITAFMGLMNKLCP